MHDLDKIAKHLLDKHAGYCPLCDRSMTYYEKSQNEICAPCWRCNSCKHEYECSYKTKEELNGLKEDKEENI